MAQQMLEIADRATMTHARRDHQFSDVEVRAEGDGSVTQRWLDDDQLEVLPAAPANTTPEAA